PSPRLVRHRDRCAWHRGHSVVRRWSPAYAQTASGVTPDIPAMDTERVDELDVLRARAYGPAADIDDDPAAIRRLEELEARRTPRAPILDDAKPVEPVEVTPDGTGGTAPPSQPTPPE